MVRCSGGCSCGHFQEINVSQSPASAGFCVIWNTNSLIIYSLHNPANPYYTIIRLYQMTATAVLTLNLNILFWSSHPSPSFGAKLWIVILNNYQGIYRLKIGDICNLLTHNHL